MVLGSQVAKVFCALFIWRGAGRGEVLIEVGWFGKVLIFLLL
jgi:hypothetical protein